MQNKLVAVILCVLYLSTGILADDDIKRGVYPFMAFLYYQDESVMDGTGSRFLQGAFLIRPDFLISSAFVSTISEDPLSKTLLARLGAIHIDANFTLNEDEDEQEQEVIEIVTPYQLNKTSWWATDISLLKTLQPFKETSAVHVTQLSTKQDYSDKVCQMLVFKKDEADHAWSLAQFSVELLPALKDNCGEQFNERTMTCGTDPQGSGQVKLPPQNFCQGNSGGPLLCDNDVIALQTYINGSCKPPYRYQFLAPWKNFLACGIEEQCDDKEKCSNVCSVALKDTPSTDMTPLTTNTTNAPATDEHVENSDEKETEVVTTDVSTTESLAEAEDASTGNPKSTESSDIEVKWPKEAISRKMLTDENRTKPYLQEQQNNVRTMTLRKVEPHRAQSTPYVGSVARKNSVVFISLIYSCFFVWVCLV